VEPLADRKARARTAVCILVKVPQPGCVKTRLEPAIGRAGSATLARAFFLDTLALVRELAWARPIVACDGDARGLEAPLEDVEVWDQGDGDLGARLERILSRALECQLDSPAAAIAIGADAPAMPAQRLEEAALALARDSNAPNQRRSTCAIGPCTDGGFYLLGLAHCPRGLLRGVKWSASDTCARTIERLRAHELAPVVLDEGFDVDRPDDLARLRGMLDRGEARAMHTLAALRELERSGCWTPAEVARNGDREVRTW
jgi:rSAM/selenodomain-associated transferase 1